MSVPAVFLDKDGTLIEDLPYNVEPARIRLAPGALDGMARLHADSCWWWSPTRRAWRWAGSRKARCARSSSG